MDAKARCKYELNGIGFRSLESIKDVCRDIKTRSTFGMEPQWGGRFSLSTDDEQFMFELIVRMHPSSPEIIGDGLATVQVGYVPPEVGKPHWGFYAIRVDGSECLFGFGKIGKSPERAQADRVSRAKRLAVSDQTIAYKEEYFDGDEQARCEATGEIMFRSECDVDHAGPTFKELDERFFAGADVAIVDDGLNWHIADAELKENWQEYHRSHAVLRCVTAKFNRSRKDAPE